MFVGEEGREKIWIPIHTFKNCKREDFQGKAKSSHSKYFNGVGGGEEGEGQ